MHIRKDDNSQNKSLVTVISRFESSVTAYVGDRAYNAKSIMSVTAINDADDMDIVIQGSDEKQAEKAILDFFSS